MSLGHGPSLKAGHGPCLKEVPKSRRQVNQLRNGQGCRGGVRKHCLAIFQARETFLKGVRVKLGFQNKKEFSRRTRGLVGHW